MITTISLVTICYHTIHIYSSGIAGWCNSSVFNLLVAIIYIAISSAGRLHFFFSSTSLPTCVICLFDDSHSDRCEIISHCVFYLYQFIYITSDAEHLFMCLMAICMASLQKCILRSSDQYLTGFLKILNFVISLCNLDIKLLSDVSFTKKSFPISQAVDDFLCCSKTFLFDALPFIYCCLCLRKQIQKVLLRPMSSGTNGKEPTCQCRRCTRYQFDSCFGKILWSRKKQPTPVFLLKNPMDRGAWQAIVHRVTKSWT